MKSRHLIRIGAAIGLAGVALLHAGVDAPPGAATERPNILWLVGEDANVNWFGCYGSATATTRNIDRLAQAGFRYANVFATAPVCAPSRSTWITGLHALSLGTGNMRSRYDIPHDQIRYYPDYLRQAGYYCSNHRKTDYNIGGRPDTDCWDSDKIYGWRFRPPGSPFFCVINFFESHESRALGAISNTRHDSAKVTLQKYHPDDPAIRKNYALYEDAVQNMDEAVGMVLEKLKQDGLESNTIVIFCTDNGGVMPRSKHYTYDDGLHLPLIIRIPEKFKSLWPAAKPGATVDGLISGVDFPKTWLSLASARIPGNLQGRIFLGPQTEPAPEYVFAYRDRMDERYDMERVVRDQRYLYIKNYQPYVRWGQHLTYLWSMTATVAWEQCYRAGKCSPVTGQFFETKPWVEELYDCRTDPDCVTNLSTVAAGRPVLERMRKALTDWQLSIHDPGLLPENELLQRAAAHRMTIYQMIRTPGLYPLPKYLAAADLALAPDPANLNALVEYLGDPDPGLRYWGACGWVMARAQPPAAVKALQACLSDTSPDVRAMAAWALIRSGNRKDGQECLISQLQHKDAATLRVLNIIDWMGGETSPYLPAIRAMAPGEKSFSSDDVPAGIASMRDYLLNPAANGSLHARGEAARDAVILEKARRGMKDEKGIPYDELIP